MRKLGAATLINIKYEDRAAWLAFRRNGLGGSEIGSILGVNKYSSAAKVFHEKIGLLDFPTSFDNEPMWWGRRNEQIISDIWQYWWNGEYINNYPHNKIRSCKRVSGYAVNPDYPHLFASIDRYIPKGTPTIDGEILQKGGILEIKTISEYEKGRWNNEVPDSYILQVHQYMLVFGADYAEIAYLMGGNKFRVVPIRFNQEIADMILYNTYHFWYDRIVPAQKLVSEYHHHLERGEESQAHKCLWEIDRLEPNPSGGKSYRELVNQKYDGWSDTTAADPAILEMAKKHKRIKEMIKVLEAEEQQMENELVHQFDLNKSEYIRFGEQDGYARFYVRAGGKNPTFENRIKGVSVDEEEIEQIKGMI